MADNTSMIAGLFMSPELYQQQRQEQFLNKASQLAQLDPSQLANVYAMQGGFGAGNVLASALGVQDPMLQQLSMRNQLASQFDTSSAEGLINLSNALRQKGDLAGASQVAQQALVAREKEANIQAKTAEKLTPQQKNAAAMADSQYQRGTPEWMAAYNKNLSELANPEKLTTDQRNYNAAVEGGYKGTFNQWLTEDANRKRPVTNINMPAPEAEFLKGMAQEDVKRVSSAITARNSAIEQLQIAERLQKTSPEALSGQFANTRAGMVNFLDSIGLTSPADKKKLLASQSLTADSSRLVLAALNNKLGGGVSNQDAKRIEQIFPQLENSPEARAELINIIIRSSQGTIEDVNRLEQYARSNRGLQGYKLRVPNVSLSTTASQMTTEQLKAIAGVK
jgi:hypothetical protein